jgi:hypothetical protein
MSSSSLDATVRAVCLALPEAEEKLSHGSPCFFVRGKQFASYAVNHHGDGRIALWLPAAPGAASDLVHAEPEHFFVPPYVGTRGWLGVRVDRGIAWQVVDRLVREAYLKVAPPALARTLAPGPKRPGMAPVLSAEEIDPLRAPKHARHVQRLREYCLSLPEATEAEQFGNPVWKAGAKTFAWAWLREERLKFAFWVGGLGQSLLTQDPRYTLPAYMAHNGWIELEVGTRPSWGEIEGLALGSYRHFALKRMLAALEAASG